jgi:hypothetical protein
MRTRIRTYVNSTAECAGAANPVINQSAAQTYNDNGGAGHNTGQEWYHTELLDLANCVRLNQPVAEIFSFMCRSRREVRDKLAELASSGQLPRLVEKAAAEALPENDEPRNPTKVSAHTLDSRPTFRTGMTIHFLILRRWQRCRRQKLRDDLKDDTKDQTNQTHPPTDQVDTIKR